MEKPKRGMHAPPLWLALMLLALLLAVLGASQPVLRFHGERAGEPFTVVVDRGITMSALEGGKPRFAITVWRVNESLQRVLSSSTQIHLRFVPGEQLETTLANWVSLVTAAPPTALDTREALIVAVQDQLARGSGRVVVITDQPLPIEDMRLLIVGPAHEAQNVAITHLAAKDRPVPQVMVRLRNESKRAEAHLIIRSDDITQQSTVNLPPMGQSRDYFFDIKSLGETIEARLVETDDQPADDRRWLVREGSFPRIEVRTSLPPSVARMAEVYGQKRPASANSKPLAIVSSLNDLAEDIPAVVVAGSADSQRLNGPIVAAVHPIAQGVQWSSLPQPVAVAPDAPVGWTPVLTIAGKTAVAIRDGPPRRVWVGFDAAGWSSSVDFVIFWANVFSWAGAGEPRYVGHPLSDDRPDWKLLDPPPMNPRPADGQWPGLYVSRDGARHALNAPDVVARATASAQGTLVLPELNRTAQGGTSVGRLLLLASLLLIVASCVVWRPPVY